MSNFEVSEMELNVEELISKPSVELLQTRKISKKDWVRLACHYRVVIKSYWRKEEVKNSVLRDLVDKEVVHEDALDLCGSGEGPEDNAVRILELEVERERLRDREREREFHLNYLEKKAQLMGEVGGDDKREPYFDLCKNVKLVPSFDEMDTDEFFRQFETIATSLKWPTNYIGLC